MKNDGFDQLRVALWAELDRILTETAQQLPTEDQVQAALAKLFAIASHASTPMKSGDRDGV